MNILWNIRLSAIRKALRRQRDEGPAWLQSKHQWHEDDEGFGVLEFELG